MEHWVPGKTRRDISLPTKLEGEDADYLRIEPLTMTFAEKMRWIEKAGQVARKIQAQYGLPNLPMIFGDGTVDCYWYDDWVDHR